MLIIASSAAAAAPPDDKLLYRPPAPWIVAAPTVADPAADGEAPFRFAYLDNQVSIAPDGTEEGYTAYRLKVLKPEGLAAGNIVVTWQPDAGSMTIHYLRLIRDGQVTDILASSKFTILQRETQLEQSALDGLRTATLQIPGLQVGDVIAFAATVRRRETAFAGHVAGLMQLPVIGTTGAYRFRLRWPADRHMAVSGSSDLPPLTTTNEDAQRVLDINLRDPKGAIPTEGAPPRYNIRRLVEYSDFGSWADVSRNLSPLFEHAATLPATSPIKAEAAAIAARTKDPVERAQAALQLVEDRVRYVYIALNGGNYLPASADQTWQRRFGDCKAKTVLLVALLRELGIEATPALVNSAGGDGMDQRLAGPRTFDHMIARAVVAGRVEWLDGTRSGDRHLDNLPAPFRWALPLVPRGVTLEKIAPRDDGFPGLIGLVTIDATAGVDHDARISVRSIIRGDEAFAIRTRLASLSADDADRALKSYWRQQVDWVTPDKVSWAYDERRMAVTLALAGMGNPGWKGDGGNGHTLTIAGAGFNPPDMMRRPTDQDQSASWAVAYPRFRCWATTILLPMAGDKLAWSLYADPMNRRLGGFTYWRASGFDGHIVRTVMSSHTYEAEASPREADIVNRAIPGFNNNMSSISEVAAADVAKAKAPASLPFDDHVDWVNAPTPCSARP